MGITRRGFFGRVVGGIVVALSHAHGLGGFRLGRREPLDLGKINQVVSDRYRQAYTDQFFRNDPLFGYIHGRGVKSNPGPIQAPFVYKDRG